MKKVLAVVEIHCAYQSLAKPRLASASAGDKRTSHPWSRWPVHVACPGPVCGSRELYNWPVRTPSLSLGALTKPRCG